MIGPAKPRRLDQPNAVSLEELVPRDHFYRHLEAKLDLSFVRDWSRELYVGGQNLKRLLAASGWGRRHAPCGSLAALPEHHLESQIRFL